MLIKKWTSPLSPLGVTLLEIMLVLAIAAMIIVMSVRYYQSANTTQQVNATIEAVQAIIASSDNLIQTGSKYSEITSGNLTNLLPTSALQTGWGTKITVVGEDAKHTFTITLGKASPAVCNLLKARLETNKRITSAGNSTTAAADCVVTVKAGVD